MADIVFKYPEMKQAVSDIADIAERYKTAASKFQTDFSSATSTWEGDSKDKMQSFIQGAVNEYLEKTLVDLVNGLSQLLQQNIDAMEKADSTIAENIPQSLS